MSKENVAVQTSFCESSEKWNKIQFIEEIITDIEEINQSLNKIFDDLSVETKKLIKEINTNAAKLKLISAETSDYQTQILEKLREELEELNPQLKQLPYSNHPIIDKLCKAINTLLEKLADFFMNGPIVGTGVYIPVPNAKPHNFDFFRSPSSPNIVAKDLSEKLSSFSTRS